MDTIKVNKPQSVGKTAMLVGLSSAVASIAHIGVETSIGGRSDLKPGELAKIVEQFDFSEQEKRIMKLTRQNSDTGVNTRNEFDLVKTHGTETGRLSGKEENISNKPKQIRKNIYFRTTTKGTIIKVTPRLNVEVLEFLDNRNNKFKFADKNPLAEEDMIYVRSDLPKGVYLYGAGMCSIGVK